MSAGTLLVTGGAGFIGSAFVRKAVARGHEVVVLDALTYAGSRANLDGVTGCELVVGDICDAPLVASLLEARRPRAIVNFAAESHVDRSIDRPAPFMATNVFGTFTLLDTTMRYWRSLDSENRMSFRVLQISTDEVYGSLGSSGHFNERSNYRPNSPYAASKASADHLVRAWGHTYGLPTVITQSCNNYGPRQHPEKLIPKVITCALAGHTISVYGTGLNRREWIHVDEHCEGLLLSLERGRIGETYCLGSGQEANNLALIRRICAALDQIRPRSDGLPHETAIAFVQDRPGHDWRYALDSTKARQELGFTSRTSLDEGIAMTVRWYLTHPEWIERMIQT